MIVIQVRIEVQKRDLVRGMPSEFYGIAAIEVLNELDEEVQP